MTREHTSIERFDPEVSYIHGHSSGAEMEQYSQGGWVRYEDYANRIEMYEKRIKELTEKFSTAVSHISNLNKCLDGMWNDNFREATRHKHELKINEAQKLSYESIEQWNADSVHENPELLPNP